MKFLGQFIRDFYNYSHNKILLNFLFMVLSSLTNGIGIVMLIPLLSLTGITGNSKINVSFLDRSFASLSQLNLSTQLLIVLLIYISLIVMQAAINRQLSILNNDMIQGYTRYQRVNLFNRILQADWACLISKRQTDITNAFTTEINRVSNGAITLLRICSQIILAIVQLYIAFILSPALTVFVMICGTVIFLFMNSTLRESKQVGKTMQNMNRELMRSIIEQLSSIKESKIYGVEKLQKNKFQEISNKMVKNHDDFIRLQSIPGFLYKVGAAVFISIFLYFMICYLDIKPAAMLIIIFIFSRLWPMFSSLQNNLQNVYIIMPVYYSLKHLEQELDDHKEKINLEKNDEITDGLKLNQSIRFENICFNYQDDLLSFGLQNINVEIPAYSITALVGKSGAGKSTLVDLLLGLLKPDSGKIWVDHAILDDNSVSAWRNVISYVPQDPFLLNDTIRENLLRFNPGASESDLWEALEMAAASEFVSKLPEGLDTEIGDRGMRLSGGERQRIVLARALIRKPQLLVLDEATSALDMENELKIQQSIQAMHGKLTIIIIAHRLATIHNADRIIILDNGEVIETGCYAELTSSRDSWFNKMLEENYQIKS